MDKQTNVVVGKKTVVVNVPSEHTNTVKRLVDIKECLDSGTNPETAISDLSFEERGELLRQMGNMFGGNRY